MPSSAQQWGTQIAGTGMAFPKRKMLNKEFEEFIETSEEWIRTRTGIESRHVCGPGETTFTMSLEASRQALKAAGVRGEDLDLIIVGTVSPDTVMPTTAIQIQRGLENIKAWGFDLSAACSGFLYSLAIADQFVSSGQCENVLVVGAEKLSTYIDWKDRTTCVLFGDGAGAAVVKRTESPNRVLSFDLHSDGRYTDILKIPHGFGAVPTHSEEYDPDQHKIKMSGREVFKLAVRGMIDSSKRAIDKAGLKFEEIDFFLFHQANIRIIDSCCQNLGIPKEKTWINVQKYGNTSAATLPVCLHEAIEAGKVKSGDNVLMATFGGGVTWGAGVVRI